MKIKPIGNSLPLDSILWRYFDFQKFLSLIIDKSLFFTRMDKMEDMNEGISMNQLLLFYGDEIEKALAINNMLNTLKRELPLVKRQKTYFLSCWLIHHRESVAMWNSYSNSDGIAIKINAQSLIKSITKNSKIVNDAEKMKTLYHGEIVYKDFFNPEHRRQFKEEVDIIGFQKDESFQHEKEYRFLIKQDTHNHIKEEVKFVRLKLNDFDSLNFDLVFHPKMEEWKKENIKSVLTAMEVKNFSARNSELNLKIW